MKLSMTPMLGVSDVQKSLDFYRDALGFQEMSRHEWEGNLLWAHASSWAAELMFTRCGNSVTTSADRESRKKLTFYFYPEDVVALHASLVEKGHRVSQLRVTFYQMKEFEMEDPDGYQLWFGQDTVEPPTPCD